MTLQSDRAENLRAALSLFNDYITESIFPMEKKQNHATNTRRFNRYINQASDLMDAGDSTAEEILPKIINVWKDEKVILSTIKHRRGTLQKIEEIDNLLDLVINPVKTQPDQDDAELKAVRRRLRKLREQRDQLREQVDSLTTNTTVVDETKLSKAIQKTRTKLESLQTELKELPNEYERLITKATKRLQKAKDDDPTVEEEDEDLEELLAKLDELNKQKDDLDNSLKELSRDHQNKKQSITTLSTTNLLLLDTLSGIEKTQQKELLKQLKEAVAREREKNNKLHSELSQIEKVTIPDLIAQETLLEEEITIMAHDSEQLAKRQIMAATKIIMQGFDKRDTEQGEEQISLIYEDELITDKPNSSPEEPKNKESEEMQTPREHRSRRHKNRTRQEPVAFGPSDEVA